MATKPAAAVPDQNKLNELVTRLGKAFASDLVSVVLYGSAASGEHHANFSDINILAVLTTITPVQLAASEPVCRWWQEQGNPSPLLLTQHELATSTDCFPIEFHDMRRSHRILFGTDLISSLAIDNSFYRAQLEHELRSKLLRLRQKAAAVLSDPDAARALLADSVTTFCVLIRHALILRGIEAEGRRREVLDVAAARLGLNPAPFLTLLDLREQKIRAKDVEPIRLLAEYLREIGKVIDAVDNLEKAVA